MKKSVKISAIDLNDGREKELDIEVDDEYSSTSIYTVLLDGEKVISGDWDILAPALQELLEMNPTEDEDMEYMS